jgi:beta-ribofuranosylaminobenzene 5'-phosphate synthase
VRVEAPARLHLGMLDLRGDLGRRFGGLGAALREPRVVVEASVARAVRAAGPDADRAAGFARRFLRHHGLDVGAEIRVVRAIPAHVGLGSGTQLALAVARALAALAGVDADAPALAVAVGRARRSAVGTWAFERGGFVLEAGRGADAARVPPLLFRHPMPAEWRCVLATPDVPRGLHGRAETEAFRRLAPPPAARVGAIARVALLVALPALLERDAAAFGRAITEIQRLVGDAFRPVQGGRFAHPLVARVVREMDRAGACGVGQSSWGPACFGLAPDPDTAARVAERVRARVPGVAVRVVRFQNRGASVRRVD